MSAADPFGGDDVRAVRAELDRLVTPEHVHRRLYTDPDIFERELRTVFGGSWAYLAHLSELPTRGSFLRRRLGRRQLVVTRAGDDSIHVVFNRCSHRGTMLVTADRGCERVFTCPYHGWRFDVDGHLRNVPVPSSYTDVRSGRFDLGRAHVAVYRGFVFGSLAEEPLDLLDWLGPARPWLDALIDRHPGGELMIHPTPLRYEFAANWKVSWDNAADGIHANFAHRSYNLLGQETDTTTVLDRNPALTPIVSRSLPHGHAVVDQRPSIPDGPWSTMRPLPTSNELVASLGERGLADRDTLDLATGSMLNLSLFPNLIFVGNQLMVVEPVEVGRTRLSVYLIGAPGAPEEVDLLRLRVDEDFVSFGTPDDFEMFERIQDGLLIPEAEWIDTSRGAALDTDDPETVGVVMGDVATEAPIRGYLNEWTRLMTSEQRLAAAPSTRTPSTQAPTPRASARTASAGSQAPGSAVRR
ncbi:MAG: Rieske 2Fe-2S domain-containing protein [Nocardioides sp.]|uniref:aromatic ring-hydroxylating oxygenase subunit alpha n=1 Tax=Nocardioides sp. TaxID=35761 RepID=UPI0039E299AE